MQSVDNNETLEREDVASTHKEGVKGVDFI